MAKLISVALTERQVIERTKTETRRLGWWKDKNSRRLLLPGDQLVPCRKVMGRRKGEPLVRLALWDVLGVRREPLEAIDKAAVVAEGFPDWSPEQFVGFFCRAMKVAPDREVTVIEVAYAEPAPDVEPSCEDWCLAACQGPCQGLPWNHAARVVFR